MAGGSRSAAPTLRSGLRVTAPLGYGSRRLVWPKGFFRRVRPYNMNDNGNYRS